MPAGPRAARRAEIRPPCGFANCHREPARPVPARSRRSDTPKAGEVAPGAPGVPPGDRPCEGRRAHRRRLPALPVSQPPRRRTVAQAATPRGTALDESVAAATAASRSVELLWAIWPAAQPDPLLGACRSALPAPGATPAWAAARAASPLRPAARQPAAETRAARLRAASNSARRPNETSRGSRSAAALSLLRPAVPVSDLVSAAGLLRESMPGSLGPSQAAGTTPRPAARIGGSGRAWSAVAIQTRSSCSDRCSCEFGIRNSEFGVRNATIPNSE